MRPLLPMLLLALPACACASAPSPEPRAPTPSGLTYAAAVGLMCDVDQKAGISAEDPVGAGVKRTAWMMEHADHPDAIELRVLLSVKEPAVQAKMLRAEAKDVGIARCALADTLEKQGEGGIAP